MEEMSLLTYPLIHKVGYLCNLLKNRPWAQSNYLVSMLDFKTRLIELWKAFWKYIGTFGINKETLFELFERKVIVNEWRMKTGYQEKIMRIFKTIKDALNETFRDLKVRGISVESKSYQDKLLTGDDRFVKELIGVAFKIDKPTLNRDDAIRYVFPNEYEKIIAYCKQEIKDRCSGKPLNPGNSYKIRSDMWNQFLLA